MGEETPPLKPHDDSVNPHRIKRRETDSYKAFLDNHYKHDTPTHTINANDKAFFLTKHFPGEFSGENRLYTEINGQIALLKPIPEIEGRYIDRLSYSKSRVSER